MTTGILGYTKGTSANELTLHSMVVMEKFANGEAYNEAVWIEWSRHAVRQTLKGMFELGRVLIVIKEHTPHGKFTGIIKTEFGLHEREAPFITSADKLDVGIRLIYLHALIYRLTVQTICKPMPINKS